MIRIPFTEVTTYHLPAIPFTDGELEYLNNFHLVHSTQLEYRWYRYPTANKITYHSATTPIDFAVSEDDFLSIDNFWDLLATSIKDKFAEYFTDEFFSIACDPKFRSVRMYLNIPNTQGVHLHKDIYSGGGTPRQLAINIPVSANSLTSELKLYDDELNLVETVHYQKNTPTALNTSVFHEVVHCEFNDIRKIITISPGTLTMNEFICMFNNGRVVR